MPTTTYTARPEHNNITRGATKYNIQQPKPQPPKNNNDIKIIAAIVCWSFALFCLLLKMIGKC